MLEIQQVLQDSGYPSALKGKGLLMLCPFHHDTRPSMQVFETGYICYACGAKGNLQNLFIELGIESAPKPDMLKSLTNRLVQSIETNLHCLIGLPNSKPFKGDYRGVKSEIYLANDAFTTEEDTVSFPLYDLDRKYRGYVKNQYGGKYINYFTQGYVPFNLHKINANAPIIVEGIFDALSVMQLGYSNVIACLGTGQVWNIAKILRQIKAGNVHILFDNDDSGVYAATNLADMYRSSTVITIPEAGKDPNNYKNLKELLECEYEIPT